MDRRTPGQLVRTLGQRGRCLLSCDRVYELITHHRRANAEVDSRLRSRAQVFYAPHDVFMGRAGAATAGSTSRFSCAFFNRGDHFQNV